MPGTAATVAEAASSIVKDIPKSSATAEVAGSLGRRESVLCSSISASAASIPSPANTFSASQSDSRKQVINPSSFSRSTIKSKISSIACQRPERSKSMSNISKLTSLTSPLAAPISAMSLDNDFFSSILSAPPKALITNSKASVIIISIFMGASGQRSSISDMRYGFVNKFIRCLGSSMLKKA